MHPSNRALRHWTIHRAWRLYQHKRHEAQERALERQYNSMYSACEALRLMDSEGFIEGEREQVGLTPLPHGSKDMGKLYRIAMLKHEIWKGVPIEYARIQTETPGREPWNHAWRR
jgi:large subunit ribosomal protein L40